MFKKNYLKKTMFIVFLFTIISFIFFEGISYASNAVANLEQSVNCDDVLGTSLEFNIENKSSFKSGQKINIFKIYPIEGKNNNEFNIMFFKANPKLNEDIKKNFDIKYFISKDDYKDDNIFSIKNLNYEEIYFDSNLNKSIKDITVYKIELTLKNELSNDVKLLSVMAPFYVDKPSYEYYRDLESIFKIYVSSDNKNANISPAEFRIKFKMKGNTNEDIYKVNLHGNEGKFQNKKDNYLLNIKSGKNISQDIETPVRDEYDFIGWSKNKDFELSDELLSSKDISNIKIISDIDFYAQWDVSKVNLIFNSNGGKFDDETEINEIKDIKKGSNLAKEDIKTPTRIGYVFKDWYEKDNNKNLKDIPFDFNTEITEDIILYAKWEKVEKPTEPIEPTEPTEPTEPIEPTDPTELTETVDIDTVILANGTKYTDVLTATVLGSEKKAPILLSAVNEVDSKTKAEIKRLNPKEIIISGGENSVSEKIKIELKKEGYKVKRISGIDRYKTAEEIAKEVRTLTGVKDEIMLVDGTNFPDVITLSPYASNKHTPILLTEPNSLNDTTKKALKEFEIEEITIGGEKDSVSKEIEKFLKADYKVSRIGGIDRYKTASLIAKEVRKQTGNKDDLILVDGTDFPDGITISSLANKYQSPIHLTNPKELTEITSKDIKDFKIKNITIGGGENSVSKAIENELKAQEIVTNRIAGIDRYATAVEISKEFTK